MAESMSSAESPRGQKRKTEHTAVASAKTRPLPHSADPERPPYCAAWSGIASFLRAPICCDAGALTPGAYDIAVMGVPTDEGSPFAAGSRLGPRRIREHSLRFYGTGRGYFDPEAVDPVTGKRGKEFLVREQTQNRIVDAGDSDVINGCPKWTFQNAQDLAAKLLRSTKLLVSLGGDHAVTLPLVRAVDEHVGEDFHVIHFDAHLDYLPFVHSPDGSESFAYSNSHAFRHIAKLKHCKTLTQVGIRSLRNSAEMMENSIGDGNRVVTMGDFKELGPRGLAETLPEGSKVYVSIDVDVLDISLCPGCVSAEPNGMMYAELRDILLEFAKRYEIIAFDFVEVCPEKDVATGVTCYLGAHTVCEFLGNICEQPWWKAKVEGKSAALAWE